jgi:hypothetical protein
MLSCNKRARKKGQEEIAKLKRSSYGRRFDLL